MLRHVSRLARQIKLTKLNSVRNLSIIYNNKDDEANRISALDRLLLIKPAISEEEDEDYESVPDDPDVELDGEPDPRMRVSKEILKLGRVYYRHIEDRPQWFQHKKDEICESRTAPQLRRCLKEWMVHVDREEIDKYISKPLIFGDKVGVNQKLRTAFAYGPEETMAYAHYFMPSRFAITERIFKELKNINPNFSPKRVVDFGCGPATAAAAAHSVWPDQVHKYCGIDMSHSMLDAAKIMTNDIIKEANFFDKSAEVIKRAEQLNERFDMAVLTYTLSDIVSDPSRRAAVQIMFELLDVGGHLVIIEPGNPKGSNMCRSARQLVLDIFNHTNDRGIAVNRATSTFEEKAKVEKLSNNPDDEDEYPEEDDELAGDSDEAAKARRHSASKVKKVFKKSTAVILPPPDGYSHNEIGAFVIAPCTHDKVCPLGDRQWCSFSQKVYSGMIRKDSQEKFSYVVIQKRPRHHLKKKEKEGEELLRKKKLDSFGTWVTEKTSDDVDENGQPLRRKVMKDPTPLSVLQRFANVEEDDIQPVIDKLIDDVDWSDYNPPLYRQEFGRLIRSPLKMKGHVTMDLCHPSGELIRNTLSRSNLLHVPSLYISLRKTSWGGLFPCLLDDTQKSALAIKAKGNRGAPKERPLDDDDDNSNDGFEVIKPANNKSQKVNKKQKEKLTVLIPGSPEAKKFEDEMMRRHMNNFTGQPLHKNVFYPKVPEPRVKKMDKSIMERYTKFMPQYLEATRESDLRLEKLGFAEQKHGRRKMRQGIDGQLNRLRESRRQSKPDDSDDE